MKSSEKPAAAGVCKSVFKSGENTISGEQFTQMWIQLINQIEKDRALHAARKE